jgi:integrase/recombinase XerD
MTALRDRAEEYLALRRALGFKLVDTEQLLMQFLTHLENIGANRITTDVAVARARQSVRAKPSYLRRRLGVVLSTPGRVWCISRWSKISVRHDPSGSCSLS